MYVLQKVAGVKSMRRTILYVMLVFALLFQSGCATLADAKGAKGLGVSKTYDRPKEEVWVAVVDVLNETELEVVSADKERGEILAQRGMTAFSYGENVAIFVEEINGKMVTRVEVVNKRALATNITAANWANRIFEKLDQRL
jgi:hypothetical protein